MAEILQPDFLPATAATLTGNTRLCTGLDKLWVEVQVNSTVASLNATLDFQLALDPQTGWLNATNGTQVGFAPAELVFVASTGRLTITNAQTGLQRIFIVFDRPARNLRPVYAFVSGGGTQFVRCIAWGWQKNTTP